MIHEWEGITDEIIQVDWVTFGENVCISSNVSHCIETQTV